MQRVQTGVVQITVTTTATSVSSLLDTANGSALNLPSDLNAIELNAEGAIRYSYGGTPTTTTGMQLNSGETRLVNGISLLNCKLISTTGSTVKVNIEVGKTHLF